MVIRDLEHLMAGGAAGALFFGAGGEFKNQTACRADIRVPAAVFRHFRHAGSMLEG
jgi:hypothetical protein